MHISLPESFQWNVCSSWMKFVSSSACYLSCGLFLSVDLCWPVLTSGCMLRTHWGDAFLSLRTCCARSPRWIHGEIWPTYHTVTQSGSVGGGAGRCADMSGKSMSFDTFFQRCLDRWRNCHAAHAVGWCVCVRVLTVFHPVQQNTHLWQSSLSD